MSESASVLGARFQSSSRDAWCVTREASAYFGETHCDYAELLLSSASCCQTDDTHPTVTSLLGRFVVGGGSRENGGLDDVVGKLVGYGGDREGRRGPSGLGAWRGNGWRRRAKKGWNVGD